MKGQRADRVIFDEAADIQLPLDRPVVDHLEWELPRGIGKIRIRLGGHFSTQSTVVVEGSVNGTTYAPLAFQRTDRSNIVTPAFTGQQSGDFREAVPFWLAGGTIGWRYVRVTATRLDSQDWIDVQFFAAPQTTGVRPDLRGVLTGTDVGVEGSGLRRHARPERGSYVISEEPDDPVELLRP